MYKYKPFVKWVEIPRRSSVGTCYSTLIAATAEGENDKDSLTLSLSPLPKEDTLFERSWNSDLFPHQSSHNFTEYFIEATTHMSCQFTFISLL